MKRRLILMPWGSSLGYGLLALLALGLSLAGCSGLAWPDQPQVAEGGAVLLESEHTLGQTFVSLEGGLTGIEVYLQPDPGAPSQPGRHIVLYLRASPDSSADLAQSSLPLDSITAPGYYRFSFGPQPASLRRDYYAHIEIESGGRVRAGTGPGSAYWAGALYQDGEPAEAQLSFRLVYAPAGVALGMLGGALLWAWWLLLAALLVIVPGWALLVWLWPEAGALSWGERLGIAAGIGCALYPILLLWTHLAGLHLGALYAWLPIIAGAVALGLLARRSPARLPATFLRVGLRAWWRSGCGWPDLSFVAVMALVLFTRWWVARPLDLPLWGDSVQHTMITQLLIDHGGLFSSWAPYAELQTFTYHFGFHALIAGFHWLSGLPAPQATLWMAQIVNVLAVLALYPLGVRLSGNRWGGVAAVLVAGLLSPHPNYYVNWGRYTQLTGQVLLPVAAYLTLARVETKRPRRGLVALGMLVVAGLALTHYRVLLMYVMFVPALVLLHWREARGLFKPLLALTAGAVLLALPWMLVTIGEPLLAFVRGLVTTLPANVTQAGSDYNSLPDLRDYPRIFWLLAGVGLVLGLLRRARETLLVLVWWVLLVGLANPAWLGLPGTGVVNNFAVFIGAYMGAALLTAAGAAWLAVPRVSRWWPAMFALILAAGLWGGRHRMNAVDAGRFMIAGRPDLRAAAWIDRYLPADAHLLANSFFAFSGTTAVGGDGGWWLPLLADRTVTLPPINYAFERGPRADYQAWVKSLPAAIGAAGMDAPAVLEMLRARGVTHVYIGQQRNQPDGGPPLLLQYDTLLASPHFRPVYHQDRVWIFELLPSLDSSLTGHSPAKAARRFCYNSAALALACAGPLIGEFLV